jgi:hypothetical protein
LMMSSGSISPGKDLDVAPKQLPSYSLILRNPTLLVMCPDE